MSIATKAEVSTFVFVLAAAVALLKPQWVWWDIAIYFWIIYLIWIKKEVK